MVARVFPDGATRADMATFLRGGEERLAAFLNIPWFCSPDARAGDIRAVQKGLESPPTEYGVEVHKPHGRTNAPLTSTLPRPPQPRRHSPIERSNRH